MFFVFLTLFPSIIINVSYSLIKRELNKCVNSPLLGTHHLSFINGHNYLSKKVYSGSKNKTILNFKEDEGEYDNFNGYNSLESQTENIVQDSTSYIKKNNSTNTVIESNITQTPELNRNEINELLEAAHNWENVKIHREEAVLSDHDIKSIEEKILKGLDDEELTVNQIVKRKLENNSRNKEKPKEDWKEVLEEFSIDVEGKKCYGCGSILQCTDNSKRGFVDQEYYISFTKDNLIRCKRCSSLSSGTYFLPISTDIKEKYTKIPDTLETNDNYDVIDKISNQSPSSKFVKQETEIDIMSRIKEASTETTNIVRNMLKIKKRKNLTILYIIDAIDPHFELGLFKLIQSRTGNTSTRDKDMRNIQNESPDTLSTRDLSKTKTQKSDIKIYLVVNKIDLLPKYKKDEVIQFFKRILNSKTGIQIKSKNIFLISCKNNININLLLSVILLEAKKLQNQILFIGPTNSGKSSLINSINNILKKSYSSNFRSHNSHSTTILSNHTSNINSYTNQSLCQSSEISPIEEHKNSRYPNNKTLTSSIVPGTTLGVIGIRLGMGLKAYDTPGIFVQDSLLSYLGTDDLKRVITNSIYSNEPIKLSKGYSLLIDKFARIDVTGGRDFFIKCYFSNKLDIITKRTNKLSDFILKHFPNADELNYPSDSFSDIYNYQLNNLQNLNLINYPDLNSNCTINKFEIVLSGWKSATCDLCIKGLGFLTLGGALKINFTLFTRKGVQLYLREPMFPSNIFPFKPRQS